MLDGVVGAGLCSSELSRVLGWPVFDSGILGSRLFISGVLSLSSVLSSSLLHPSLLRSSSRRLLRSSGRRVLGTGILTNRLDIDALCHGTELSHAFRHCIRREQRRRHCRYGRNFNYGRHLQGRFPDDG